jgi:hypothetical protein
MKAVKGNMEYDITENDVNSFVKEGYDIYDHGKLVAYGEGKTVSYPVFMQLRKNYDALMLENAKMSAEIEELKAELAKKRKSVKKEEKDV